MPAKFPPYELIGGDIMMWSYLVHLGFNMWREQNGPVRAEFTNASPVLRFDDDMWKEIVSFAVDAGINTLILDIGEGLKYDTHPELAVQGSWSPDRLKREVAGLRALGITPIPKLNFSTFHDEWLGEYSRCVSSPKYYEVCRDLINEVIDLFGTPEYFHLGMDEEKDTYAQYWGYSVIRNGDFWWKDLYFFIDILEKKNVRPIIWADACWSNKSIFAAKCPKTVILSNWYYGDFTVARDIDIFVRTYDFLDSHGFIQMPCGMQLNILRTVKYCMDHIRRDRLLGFIQTSWKPTILIRKYSHLCAMDLLRQAREGFYGKEEMFAGWKGPDERGFSYAPEGKDLMV